MGRPPPASYRLQPFGSREVIGGLFQTHGEGRMFGACKLTSWPQLESIVVALLDTYVVIFVPDRGIKIHTRYQQKMSPQRV